MKPQLNVPTRLVTVEGFDFMVPRGVARNNRNRAWQVKVARGGQVVLAGNYADDTYGGTKESLEFACRAVAEASIGQESNTLRVNDRVTLGWAQLGVGTLGCRATVYDPKKRKGDTIYLIAYRKLLAGKSDQLVEKLARALERDWRQENDREAIPMVELLRIRREVGELIVSEGFAAFTAKAAEQEKVQTES